MFSLRPRSFFDYGFPHYRSAPSPFFGDLLDDFFEPAPTFEFVPVVYRSVNRGIQQPNQKPRSEKKRAQERLEQNKQQQEGVQTPTPEANPEQKAPASAANQQQVAERAAGSTSFSTLPDTFNKPLDMQVKDEDARLVVSADLHGVPQDKIDLSIENGLLRLAATRLHEHKDENSAMRYQEMLQRAVALPAGVDESQITATYSDGVLEIVVPKPESARRKRINIGIKAASPAPAAIEQEKKATALAEKTKCTESGSACSTEKANCADSASCGVKTACEAPAASTTA